VASESYTQGASSLEIPALRLEGILNQRLSLPVFNSVPSRMLPDYKLPLLQCQNTLSRRRSRCRRRRVCLCQGRLGGLLGMQQQRIMFWLGTFQHVCCERNTTQGKLLNVADHKKDQSSNEVPYLLALII
jgi:hypothetical protein